MILLTLAGLATFDGIGQALLPPAVYLTISTLQNNLVSPVAYGRRLRLNPVAILIGVLFWYYLWGVAGAFLGGADHRHGQGHRRSSRAAGAGGRVPGRLMPRQVAELRPRRPARA